MLVLFERSYVGLLGLEHALHRHLDDEGISFDQDARLRLPRRLAHVLDSASENLRPLPVGRARRRCLCRIWTARDDLWL